MRLKPIPDWLGLTLCAPVLVAAAPFIVIAFGLAALVWLKRQAIGPTGKWQRWFAWYPVSVEWGDIRWLEFVERRSFAIMQDTQFRQQPTDIPPNPTQDKGA